MKTPNWKKFERVVAAIHRVQASGGDVRWNDTIDGRQFDVTVRFKFGVHEYLTVIECKHYSGRVSVETIDAFVTKARDAKANKAVLVSSNGYQAGCFEVAARHGVSLLVLSESVAEDVAKFTGEFTPAINVYRVELVLDTGQTFELDEEAGRLPYLMRHTKLKGEPGVSSTQEVLDRWQRSRPALSFDTESDAEIKLAAGTRAFVPYEGEFGVQALRFRYKLVNAQIVLPSGLDPRIQDSLSTEYQLTDEGGNVLQTAKLRDLPLSAENSVEPEKFYSQANGFHYYCYKVLDQMVTWIAIETYQHGHLAQATLTQKIEYSKYFFEVTDAKTLMRLNRMLQSYLEQHSANLERE